LLLLLVGELFGLHTLRQILDAHGVKSNNWAKVYASISYAFIEQSISQMLLGLVGRQIAELASKSESTWSRAEVTVVFDDSIFKQWLKDEPVGEYFAKYFSGQFNGSVYGLRITLCGLSIGDTFYPTHVHLSHKNEDTKEVGRKLLKKLHGELHRWSLNYALEYPNLFVSADSGFDCVELLDLCAELSKVLPITPICVPKKNHLFQSGSFSGSFQLFIEQGYLPAEAAYLEKCQKEGRRPEPFLMRVRGVYTSKDREVVLLVFRLNGSKKVSLIYSTDLNAKSKTLRRRWFQRTLIEQFFRLLKDTLKIQQSKVTDHLGFLRKLWVWVFKAIHCQLFRNYCRRHFRLLKGWSFGRLRLRITAHRIESCFLEALLADSN
jgi:hypothetical protein